MMKLSQSFSFADIMGDLVNFEMMISTATAVIADTLDCASFVETLSTGKITTLKWPRGVPSITYISEKCLVTEKELQEEIDIKYKDIADTNKIVKAITVRLMDLSWMLKDKMKFLRLTQILSATEYDSIFVTEFVK